MKSFNRKKIIGIVASAAAVLVISLSVLSLAGGLQTQPTDSGNKEAKTSTQSQETAKSDETSNNESSASAESTQAPVDNQTASQDQQSSSNEGAVQQSTVDNNAAAAQSGSGTDASNSSAAPSNSSSTNNSNNPQSSSSDSEASSQKKEDGSTPAEEKKQEQQDDSKITVTISVDGAGYGDVSFSGSVRIDKGGSVYDALVATGITINARDSQYGVYVAAIGGLAEKSAGGESGWKYSVNGVEPNCSCGLYNLSGGEKIKWKFVTKASEEVG